MTEMIRLDGVSKIYPGQPAPAVADLTLSVEDGEIVVLLGPSGCGKTTTLRLINRLIEPTSGESSWINYLKHTTPIGDPAKQYQAVAQQDLSGNHVKWLAAAPANDTYAVGAKATAAQALGITDLSGYAKLAQSDPAKATMCVASEFAGRSDGWPGLQKAYGFKVPSGKVATLAEGAIYNAIAKRNPCTFGEVTTTDGRVKALGLTLIADDKSFFPVYNPALTVREQVYRDHPAVERIADPIAAALTNSVLQGLNGQVDIKGKQPVDVARAWLQSKAFIGS